MQRHVFNSIIQTRKLFVELIDGMSLEQLNQIPSGFNNNIGWNFGHIVVTTPALCYVRTGVRKDLEIPFFPAYKKDSKPEYWITEEELDALKVQTVTSIEQIEQDYLNNVFSHITPYSTSTYVVEMYSIEEVILCTLMHDNLHLGYAQAQRRAIWGTSKR